MRHDEYDGVGRLFGARRLPNSCHFERGHVVIPRNEAAQRYLFTPLDRRREGHPRSRHLVGFEVAIECILQSPDIEDVFGGALGADRLHLAEPEHMPVPVPNLDVDLATRIVGRQQHGRLLARAFPPVRRWRGANRAALVRQRKAPRHRRFDRLRWRL